MSKHESMNHFEVLGLSPDEICGKDDTAIADLVKKSHARLYRKALDSRYAIRSDGISRADWMDILIEARDTLENPQKRQAYLTSLGLVEEKGRLLKPKLGRIWDLADSGDTVTKPDVQPSKDNRGVGGKQPRQPASEEARVNKGDARLPGWVRVWGGLWCVIIPGLILFLWLDAGDEHSYDDGFAMISLALAILGFCIWVLATLSLGVPFRTRVGIVFKVIVAMLAAFTLFTLSVFLIGDYLGYHF